ncbi:MAG: hypothetical protein ACLTDR_02695 [Adlercreutzia equolifaciens]
MDTPSHPSITLSSEQRVENGVVYTDDVARQRAIAYDMLREFSAKRAAYYRDSSKISLKKLSMAKMSSCSPPAALPPLKSSCLRRSAPAKVPRKRSWAACGEALIANNFLHDTPRYRGI